MARYFFDYQDGELIEDVIGIDLANDEAAQDYAVELAEDILQDREEGGGTHPWRVIIKDSTGHVLGTVTSVTV